MSVVRIYLGQDGSSCPPDSPKPFLIGIAARNLSLVARQVTP